MKDKKINIKSIFKKIMNFFKKIITFIANFWRKNIVNKIIMIAVLVIIIVLILLCVFRKEVEKFALNEFYDVYPEEVRKLYTNIVEVSCTGDLHLDIKVDDKATPVDKLNKNTLLDYLFNNIDKNGGLTDKIDVGFIKRRQKELFNLSSDLTEAIKDYQHGDYVYNVNGNSVTRKKSECKSDIKYVTFLYGYSWNKDLLSMDVNISYQKGDMLYDLNDKELGNYDGDVSKLFNLTKTTSYYRFNYVKRGNDFELDSVSWLNRS